MNFHANILNLDLHKEIGYNTAKSRLYNLKKKGKIMHIRKGVYLPAGMQNKFQIAGNAVENGVLCYHTALEYYNLHTQSFNWTYVHSDKPFRTFEYMGETYIYKRLKFTHNPVIDNKNKDYPIRVTSLEQTIVDCIHNIGLSGGLEELMFALVDIPIWSLELKEGELLACLKKQANKSLYQRTGFLLSHFKDSLKLSEKFFQICKKEMGNTISYLLTPHESPHFNKEWNICAPKDILNDIKKGV